MFQKSLSIGRTIGQWFYCPFLFAAVFDAALSGCSATPMENAAGGLGVREAQKTP